MYAPTPNSSVRQVYGWLLEDRSENESLHLANLGWSEWTAALCGVTAESDLYPVLIIKCSVLPVLPILAHTTQCSLLSVLITKCYHYQVFSLLIILTVILGIETLLKPSGGQEGGLWGLTLLESLYD